MKVRILIIALMFCSMCLVSGQLYAITVTGIPGASGDAEYLFGYSGGAINYLDLGMSVGGSITVDTATNLLSSGYNQGWWSGSASNNDTNDNTFVGDLGDYYNNFFTFYIGSVTGTVSSATFRGQRFVSWSDTGRTYQPYSFFDVFTDPLTLNTNNGVNGSIFSDLGSGINYGSYNLPVEFWSNQTGIYILSLNSNAIADLNSAVAHGDQYFSIGGTLTPSTPPIPEPGTLLLLGVGLVGLVGYGKLRLQPRKN